MIIKLPLAPNLIQTVRTAHALMEVGYTISLTPDEVPAYEYLSRFFKLNYTLKSGRTVDVRQSHSFPMVRVGKIQRPLLYAHSCLTKYQDYWSDKRDIDFLFVGLMPPHRAKVLEEWENRATIIETRGGREGVQRYWDEDYIRLMGRSRFILCPDGGFSWTYRFFEAILCGATPVIQNPAKCYAGFHYQNWNDSEFAVSHIVDNIEFAKKRLTIPKIEIIKTLKLNPLHK